MRKSRNRRHRANGADEQVVRVSPIEHDTIGALLTFDDAFAHASAAGLTEADFEVDNLRRVYKAITDLAIEQKPVTVATVADHLDRTGQHIKDGWLAFLGPLVRETLLQPDEIGGLIKTLKERAIMRRLGARDDVDLGRMRRELAALDALNKPLVPKLVLRHVADIVDERREPEWLNGLHKILERYVIAILAGFRGTLKSFIAVHWSMLAAINGESVVILSGEGAGLGRRAEAWMRAHAPAKNVRDLRLFVLERAVNLNLAETMHDLQAAIDSVYLTPGLIVIDTLSKFTPGMKENASEETAAFLYLVSTALRDRYRCTVLIVAHAGHGEAKRPRGSSVLMANPDAEYIVERQDARGMTATVTRERFKDSPSLPPLAYAAEVVDLGRGDRNGEPVTSLVMRDTEALAPTADARPELRGKAQRQLLAALRVRSPDGSAIWTTGDLREIGRQAGMHKNTARAAADALTFTSHLKTTVGGWSLVP
jgi:hypothetical protein